MLKAPLFDEAGAQVGEIELPAGIFLPKPSIAVMHQVVVGYQANRRQGTHDTKTKREVRGGGRKPWRQKGTGRARAGSIRSPLWRKGGIAHGPKPRKYTQRLPQKMRHLALASALGGKARDGEVKVVEALTASAVSTKAVRERLAMLQLHEGKSVLVVVDDIGHDLRLSTRNLDAVSLSAPAQLNAEAVLHARTLLFTKAGLDALLARGSLVGERRLARVGAAA